MTSSHAPTRFLTQLDRKSEADSVMLFPIHHTSRVLACLGSQCVEIDVASGAVNFFAAPTAHAMGGGGWDGGYVCVVDMNGKIHERLSSAAGQAADGVYLENIGSVHALSCARDVRRVARVAHRERPTIYRADSCEVFDLDAERSIRTITPPTDDCFEIDQVALSPNGELLLLSGMAIRYTSEGDWASGQNEQAFLFDVASGDLITQIEVGETWRPSQHRYYPVSIAKGACMIDQWCLRLDGRPIPKTIPDPDNTLDRRVNYETSSVLMFDDGGYAALLPNERRLQRGNIFEPLESDEALTLESESPPSTMTSCEGALVLGFDDGRIVAIER